jgi:rubrerythrin
MVSVCLRCHQVVSDDAICCSELRSIWTCRRCHETLRSFVVPFGRCFLCGGELDEGERYRAGEAARIVEEALQFEVDSLQFYRLGRIRAKDPHQRALFDQFARMERAHIAELEGKYHVHLDPRILDMVFDAELVITGWLFEGITFDSDEGGLEPLYRKALEMERRTRDHFRRRAEALPEGPEKAICRELAAEEEQHVALMEAELAQVTAAGRQAASPPSGEG